MRSAPLYAATRACYSAWLRNAGTRRGRHAGRTTVYCATLPAMSQERMSMADSAASRLAPAPRRHADWRFASSMRVDCRRVAPTHIAPMSVSAATLAGEMRMPSLHHPVMPRTVRRCARAHVDAGARLATLHRSTGPSSCIGILMTMVSTLVIHQRLVVLSKQSYCPHQCTRPGCDAPHSWPNCPALSRDFSWSTQLGVVVLRRRTARRIVPYAPSSVNVTSGQQGGKDAESHQQPHDADGHRRSYPRPLWFTESLHGRSFKAALGDSLFPEQYMDAVACIINAQEAAGLDIVTDGDSRFDLAVGGKIVVLLSHRAAGRSRRPPRHVARLDAAPRSASGPYPVGSAGSIQPAVVTERLSRGALEFPRSWRVAQRLSDRPRKVRDHLRPCPREYALERVLSGREGTH